MTYTKTQFKKHHKPIVKKIAVKYGFEIFEKFRGLFYMKRLSDKDFRYLALRGIPSYGRVRVAVRSYISHSFISNVEALIIKEAKIRVQWIDLLSMYQIASLDFDRSLYDENAVNLESSDDLYLLEEEIEKHIAVMDEIYEATENFDLLTKFRKERTDINTASSAIFLNSDIGELLWSFLCDQTDKRKILEDKFDPSNERWDRYNQPELHDFWLAHKYLSKPENIIQLKKVAMQEEPFKLEELHAAKVANSIEFPVDEMHWMIIVKTARSFDGDRFLTKIGGDVVEDADITYAGEFYEHPDTWYYGSAINNLNIKLLFCPDPEEDFVDAINLDRYTQMEEDLIANFPDAEIMSFSQFKSYRCGFSLIQGGKKVRSSLHMISEPDNHDVRHQGAFSEGEPKVMERSDKPSEVYDLLSYHYERITGEKTPYVYHVANKLVFEFEYNK